MIYVSNAKKLYFFLVDVSSDWLFFLSSNNILTEGPYVSSYWPLLMFQMKATRKPMAMVRDTEIRRMMISIFFYKVGLMLQAASFKPL
jgi:hypothetical protein